MNTRSVNSAAGVILAALEQNRTSAGIALALESAGLLMSPEAAADLASVSTDAVERLDKAVAELRREHEISAQLRARVDEVDRKYTFDTAELKRQLESARVDGQRLIRSEQRTAELEAVLGTHRKDDQAEIERLRARVAELEAEPLAWAWKLDAKSLDNFLIALGTASEHEPMDEAVDRIHELLRSYREATSVDGITWRIAPTQALRETGGVQ